MLKAEILKLTELTNKQMLDKEKDINLFLNKLPTIQKMFIVQNLLKELISIKNPFLDTKNKMIEKIENNCHKYFKNTIQIKQIYDYCDSKKPETTINYNLLQGKESENVLHDFEEGNKNFIENFFLELRNNNLLMMKIIKEIDITYYEQLGYFLTHFLYENTTNTNFSQDELNLMLYLVMEDTIKNKFPNEFSQEFLYQLNSEKQKIFLYFFVINLTKKVEIRLYLSNIFHDLILDLESKNQRLSINTTTLIEDIINPNEDLEENKGNDMKRKSTMNPHNLLKNYKNFFKNNDASNQNKKNPLRQTMFFKQKKTKENQQEQNEDKDFLANFKKRKSEAINNNLNLENIYDIKKFFEENNFTTNESSKYLVELNNKNEDKTDIENAFMEFLLFLRKESRKKGSKEYLDIYSNNVILESFNEFKNEKIQLEEDRKNIDEIYINNFFTITEFIQNLFEKIMQSIDSLPYTIKCLLFFLDKLASKKYESIKLSYYQKLIIKLKFFFDGFILPILKNPFYNGCISDGVISDTTVENLKIISVIVEKFVSGNLFKIVNENIDPYYIIFNKFIVEHMQDLLEIQIAIDEKIKNKFEPPKFIMDLFESSDLNERNINYDFFKFNENESIQYQSVCFSYFDLIMFINTCEKENIKNYLESNGDIKSDFQLLLKYKIKNFEEGCKNNLANNKKEFFLITNLKYKESFLKTIKSVTEEKEEFLDNYFKNQKNNSEMNENILLFKQCLIEVMIYLNRINKEDINAFIKRKNKLVLYHNSKIDKYLLKKRIERYEDMLEERKDSINNNNDIIQKNLFNKLCLSNDLMEDGDFLEEIFPRLIAKLKAVLGHLIDYAKYERIIFCITFLQLNIKNLLQIYCNNNYSKLFIEMINDAQNMINMIKGLQNNILNQFHIKIREGDKLNLILSKYSLEIKSMEKYYTINYLFNKLTPHLPTKDGNPKVEIKKEKTINHSKNTPSKKTFSISLSQSQNPLQSQSFQDKTKKKSIIYFIKHFHNYISYLRGIVEDILTIEKEDEIPKIFRNYFTEINSLVKEEKIIEKYKGDELMSICYDLENYILLKIHNKILPDFASKCDDFIYKKCARLDFIKPEHLNADKKMINENLLLTVVEYINKIDTKYTPNDKINMLGKAFQFLEGSMKFTSGKDVGTDDVLPLFHYVMIKAKPKMLYTNFIFCKYYLNSNLLKKHTGYLLTQIGMVIKIICNMKYTQLQGVTEEQFGVDEEMPKELIDTENKLTDFNS